MGDVSSDKQYRGTLEALVELKDRVLPLVTDRVNSVVVLLHSKLYAREQKEAKDVDIRKPGRLPPLYRSSGVQIDLVQPFKWSQRGRSYVSEGKSPGLGKEALEDEVTFEVMEALSRENRMDGVYPKRSAAEGLKAGDGLLNIEGGFSGLCRILTYSGGEFDETEVALICCMFVYMAQCMGERYSPGAGVVDVMSSFTRAGTNIVSMLPVEKPVIKYQVEYPHRLHSGESVWAAGKATDVKHSKPREGDVGDEGLKKVSRERARPVVFRSEGEPPFVSTKDGAVLNPAVARSTADMVRCFVFLSFCMHHIQSYDMLAAAGLSRRLDEPLSIFGFYAEVIEYMWMRGGTEAKKVTGVIGDALKKVGGVRVAALRRLDGSKREWIRTAKAKIEGYRETVKVDGIDHKVVYGRSDRRKRQYIRRCVDVLSQVDRQLTFQEARSLYVGDPALQAVLAAPDHGYDGPEYVELAGKLPYTAMLLRHIVTEGRPATCLVLLGEVGQLFGYNASDPKDAIEGAPIFADLSSERHNPVLVDTVMRLVLDRKNVELVRQLTTTWRDSAPKTMQRIFDIGVEMGDWINGHVVGFRDAAGRTLRKLATTASSGGPNAKIKVDEKLARALGLPGVSDRDYRTTAKGVIGLFGAKELVNIKNMVMLPDDEGYRPGLLSFRTVATRLIRVIYMIALSDQIPLHEVYLALVNLFRGEFSIDGCTFEEGSAVHLAGGESSLSQIGGLLAGLSFSSFGSNAAGNTSDFSTQDARSEHTLTSLIMGLSSTVRNSGQWDVGMGVSYLIISVVGTSLYRTAFGRSTAPQAQTGKAAYSMPTSYGTEPYTSVVDLQGYNASGVLSTTGTNMVTSAACNWLPPTVPFMIMIMGDDVGRVMDVQDVAAGLLMLQQQSVEAGQVLRMEECDYGEVISFLKNWIFDFTAFKRRMPVDAERVSHHMTPKILDSRLQRLKESCSRYMDAGYGYHRLRIGYVKVASRIKGKGRELVMPPGYELAGTPAGWGVLPIAGTVQALRECAGMLREMYPEDADVRVITGRSGFDLGRSLLGVMGAPGHKTSVRGLSVVTKLGPELTTMYSDLPIGLKDRAKHTHVGSFDDLSKSSRAFLDEDTLDTSLTAIARLTQGDEDDEFLAGLSYPYSRVRLGATIVKAVIEDKDGEGVYASDGARNDGDQKLRVEGRRGKIQSRGLERLFDVRALGEEPEVTPVGYVSCESEPLVMRVTITLDYTETYSALPSPFPNACFLARLAISVFGYTSHPWNPRSDYPMSRPDLSEGDYDAILRRCSHIDPNTICDVLGLPQHDRKLFSGDSGIQRGLLRRRAELTDESGFVFTGILQNLDLEGVMKLDLCEYTVQALRNWYFRYVVAYHLTVWNVMLTHHYYRAGPTGVSTLEFPLYRFSFPQEQ